MSIAPEDNSQEGQAEPDLRMPDEPEIPTAPAPVTPKLKKNWETKDPLMTEISEEEADKKFQGIVVPLLPNTASEVNELMMKSGMPEVDVNADTVSWYRNLQDGFRSLPGHGVFEDILADPEADWTNVLSFNGQNINVGKPKFFNRGKGGSSMSSERVLLSVRSTLGMGAPVQSPLLASGFYVTSKPLGENEIIALWRDIIAETVKLGRRTYGLMFANNQVFAARSVANAWKKTIVETTVSDMDPDKIFDYIPINDLPIIYQSVATSLYPNGFPMKRSLFSEETGLPTKELTQIIDIRKSLFPNRKMFKDEQLAHMTKRIERPMTMKMVQDYRDQFVFTSNNIVDIGVGVKLHLKTPSLSEYFASGEKWVGEIITAVHEALGEDPAQADRLTYITNLAKASRLRQYAHYVSAIEQDGEMFTTRENVEKVLYGLSESDEITEKFMKGIYDYINSTQVAVIATTSVNEYEDTMSGNKWPRLIPIDALSVFFQLVEQKLHGIMSRSLGDT